MQESQAWLIPPIDQQLVQLANQAEVQAVAFRQALDRLRAFHPESWMPATRKTLDQAAEIADAVRLVMAMAPYNIIERATQEKAEQK